MPANAIAPADGMYALVDDFFRREHVGSRPEAIVTPKVSSPRCFFQLAMASWSRVLRAVDARSEQRRLRYFENYVSWACVGTTGPLDRP
jgi:hypothetical protein